ncbi:MAG: Fe-S cluster assembly protein SufD, partial [Acidimicrobiales bacterium]
MSTAVSTAFSPGAAGALPGPDWLAARRRAAAHRFATTPLPSPEEEVWRYSRIGDLDLSEHTPIPAGRPGFDDDEFVQMAA